MNSAAESTRAWKVRLGWIVLLIVVTAPLAFFFLTTPKDREEESAPPREKRVPTKLESVGLRENRDLEALPEIFAVWAERAAWKNDRTRFAYWNPSTRAYDYFFEARRTAKGYRFREIPEPHDATFEWDPDTADDTPLRLYLPIRPRPEDPVRPVDSPRGKRSSRRGSLRELPPLKRDDDPRHS
jgi:hypothetical protein